VRYWRGRPQWLAPAWGPTVRDIVGDFYDSPELPFEYEVQRAHWRDLTSARLGVALDLQQSIGARYGVEFRFPFLDQDLVEFVLALPPDVWPLQSPGARLQRDAMREVLPSIVEKRRTKAIFSGAIGHLLRRAAPQVKALLYENEWLSEKYVIRQHARELFRRASAASSWQDGWRDWLQVRAIAALEAWLRRIFGYSPPSGDIYV
jgi:asparagine synthase (glutamine-hydrolysing)